MLSISNVKKSFRQPDGTPLPILDVPRFEVAAGEQMVLVGQSGGGKTTLLHVISGITRPDSGSVKVGEFGSFRTSSGSCFLPRKLPCCPGVTEPSAITCGRETEVGNSPFVGAKRSTMLE